MRIRALLPDTAVRGVRAALWARNSMAAGNGCADNYPGGPAIYYGEVDALEWYGDNSNTGHSVTHLGCSGTETIQQDNRSTLNPDHRTWLEWIVRREGNTITYELGSPVVGYYPIAVNKCGETPFVSFPGGACDAILNDPFHVILQTEVRAGVGAPLNGQNFPRSDLKVDWVRITYLP